MALLRSAVLALFALAGGQAIAGGFPAILADQPPKLLSGYGFFEGAGIANPADGVTGYDLVTPLFSDGAVKSRHVHVPSGASARFDPREAFDFPVGSALVKTFAFPADFRQPDRNLRLIETRVLLRQRDGWQAMAYVWNEAQDDAVLRIAGKRLPISFIDRDGKRVSFSYAVPNRNQCKGCHSLNGEIVPLGPKARNLNRSWGGDENQLSAWAAAGMLSGLPPLGEVQKAGAMDDEAAGIGARARSWLDVNCAHCHRREGPASNSGLFLTFDETDQVALGIGKRPVAAGRGAGANSFDVVPGHPEQSILLARVASTEPGVMMPELGRNLADEEAVELLRSWIAGLR